MLKRLVRRDYRLLAACLLAVVTTGARPLQNQPTLDPEVARLAALGRVWLLVKYADPRVALTTVDWDGALINVLPRVLAAVDDQAFADAVDAMLSTLHDPVTRLVRVGHEQASSAVGSGEPATAPKVTVRADGSLLVDLRRVPDPRSLEKVITDNLEALVKADRLILDLRGSGKSGIARVCGQYQVPGYELGTCVVDPLMDLLVARPTVLPATRSVMNSAFEPRYVIAPGRRVVPRDGVRARPVVFVLDGDAIVPPIAETLQAEGAGALLAQGELPASSEATVSLPLTGSYTARVRVEDFVRAGARLNPRADMTVSVTDSDDTIYARASALRIAESAASGGVDDAEPIKAPDTGFGPSSLPDEAHRLLAAYRLWGTIEYFHPYKRLMDRPWDGVLAEFIPQVRTARNELQYAQAMARMAARTQDTHVRVLGSKALKRFLGEQPAAAFVQFVEGAPLVTRILDANAAGGLSVGDEVLSVDGESVDARARRIEPFMAFSTTASRDNLIAERLLAGDASSRARLTIRRADGVAREVTVERAERFRGSPERDGDVWRLVDGDIGYVDLNRLAPGEVGSVFERFRNTRGLIFDMRGYPHGAAWEIAPRINTRKPAAAALVVVPLLIAGSPRQTLSYLQELPSGYPFLREAGASAPMQVYEQPTVMLIDQRAFSQSEHSGLFFKAANDTTFIGSPTTGVEGTVTSVSLPGGLTMQFSGQEVRYPDGRQVQRVGLVPDVAVRPTIAGIRAGRDEVLERAIEYLKNTRPK